MNKKLKRNRYHLFYDPKKEMIIEIYLYAEFGHRIVTKNQWDVKFTEPNIKDLIFIGYID